MNSREQLLKNLTEAGMPDFFQGLGVGTKTDSETDTGICKRTGTDTRTDTMTGTRTDTGTGYVMEFVAGICEIRFRTHRPVVIHTKNDVFYLDIDGKLIQEDNKILIESSFNNNLLLKKIFITDERFMARLFDIICKNSSYAFADEIRNSFISLHGGHRAGITGKAVIEEGRLRHIKEISGINIRFAGQVIGCAHEIIEYIVKNGNIKNTLIVSPPMCGKTTIIRDLARILGSGLHKELKRPAKVFIIDERAEIAASYRGIPQNDIGIMTDVITSCPKSTAILNGLRSMSPEVVITDELGDEGDYNAVSALLNAGVKIIATAHGYNISSLQSRKEVINLLSNNVFERYIVLSNVNGPGTIEEIIEAPGLGSLYRRTA